MYGHQTLSQCGETQDRHEKRHSPASPLANNFTWAAQLVKRDSGHGPMVKNEKCFFADSFLLASQISKTMEGSTAHKAECNIRVSKQWLMERPKLPDNSCYVG